MYMYQNTPYLEHHGIKGQKWGIRRFQNEDGSLTEAGKGRYNRGVPESKTWKPEEAAYLSDEELRRRNNRLNSERSYREATTPQWKKTAKDIAKRVLLNTAVATLAAVVAVQYRKLAAPLLKENKDKAVAAIKTEDFPKKVHELFANANKKLPDGKVFRKNN